MTTASKPDVWMIVINDNPISVYYRDKVATSWLNQGYKLNLFDAVVPKDLPKYNDLTFDKKHSLKRGTVSEFTETEKSVWYSHYLLWKQCWEDKTPMIVCEHDVELIEPISNKMFRENMICLAHDPATDEKPNTKLAGGAYYITPEAARWMLRIQRSKIKCNSDWVIHDTCNRYGIWSEGKCRQIKNPEIGVTVTHNK